MPICRRGWAAAALALGMAGPAAGLDPERGVGQYVRDRWGAEHGLPASPIYAIAQTADGYLWVGTGKGLYRFDGVRFQRLESGDPEMPVTTVLGLTADPDGSLWVRLRRPALLRYREGRFENLMTKLGRPRSTVSATVAGRDGRLLVWVLEGEGSAIRLTGERFETVTPAAAGLSRSPVYGLVERVAGEVWIGTRDAGAVRLRGRERWTITAGLPDPKINALWASGGTVWLATDGGVARWREGVVDRPVGVGSAALALTVDRDANVWIGTNGEGLVRWDGRRRAARLEPAGRFIEAVTAVFEDREGNLWSGSARGLERLRESAFVSYGAEAGVPEEGGVAVGVGLGEVLAAPAAGGLRRWRGERFESIPGLELAGDTVYALAGGEGEWWLGRQQGGVTRLRRAGGAFRMEHFTEADGLAQNSVYALLRARDGAVWAGTVSGGVSCFREGRWRSFGLKEGLGSNAVTALAEGADGAVWVGTAAGVSRWQGGRWRSYGEAEGLPAGAVTAMTVDPEGGVWAGTSAGPALLGADGRFRVVEGLPAALRAAVWGMESDGRGGMWLGTARAAAVRVDRAALRRGHPGAGELWMYGAEDGLIGSEAARRHRAVTRDGRGRIWVATNRGVAMADPARMGMGASAAKVRIEEVAGDGVVVAEGGGLAKVAAGVRRVRVEYAGLSLAVPERVQFRYRLDGFDRDWSAPTGAREAIYTNLTPGRYRFRVMASNAEGIWNSGEAAVEIDVAAAVWQTGWFQALAAAVMGLAGWLGHRARMAQLSRGLEVRFAERLAERTRIAQELHDTLLQGFLSVSMQLHVVHDGMAEGSGARGPLGRVLEAMGRGITEGRRAVQGLRGGVGRPLAEALAGLREAWPEADEVDLRVVVEGRVRPLHPVMEEEALAIGREALENAFRHARASRVEVGLEYTRGRFRLLVRDNGQGIGPGTGAGSGLGAMRERSERFGARLRVWSARGAGTEVEFSIPGELAYQRRDR